MTFMFAIPLIGGALPALVGHLAKAQPVPRLTRQAWALVIACLTVASCLRGIFEIAGTSSAFLWVYPPVALVFAFIAVVTLLRQRIG